MTTVTSEEALDFPENCLSEYILTRTETSSYLALYAGIYEMMLHKHTVFKNIPNVPEIVAHLLKCPRMPNYLASAKIIHILNIM